MGCQSVSQRPVGAVLSWLSLAVLSGRCWELGTAECPQTFLSWQVLNAGLGCEQGGRGQSLRAAQQGPSPMGAGEAAPKPVCPGAGGKVGAGFGAGRSSSIRIPTSSVPV